MKGETVVALIAYMLIPLRLLVLALFYLLFALLVMREEWRAMHQPVGLRREPAKGGGMCWTRRPL